MSEGASVDLVSIILDVGRAVFPIILFFLIFQSLYIRYPWPTLKKLLLGILITSVGIVLFLAGVYLSYMPVAKAIGEHVVINSDSWWLMVLGFVLGFMATFAEPGVRVLAFQVENSSSGFIGSRMLIWILSLGVATIVALAMARIVYGLDFRAIMVGGYLLAMVMIVLADKDFIAVAFDAGGVATGPIAVSILMSLAVGIATANPGSDPVIDGFGLIALIALAPILFIGGLGIIIRFKKKVEV